MRPYRSREPSHGGVRTSHTLRTAYAVIGALAMLCWLVLPAAGARADDPIVLSRTGQITDRVDALGDRKGAVGTALRNLDDVHRVQLYVAYVRDFSGRSAQNWADATAERNGLGLNDVLLAVATHDRQYAYSVDRDSQLTDAQLQDVAQTAVEPALRQNDWAGAAIGAADGIGAVLAGMPVPTPAITPGEADPGGAGSHRGAGDLFLPVVVIAAALAFAWYVYARRRKRSGPRTTQGWGSPGPSGTESVPLPLPELDQRARELLVDTDDAVRTSTEELGFATAQFGEEAAAPYSEALGYAQSQLTVAFRLRQQLDDAMPEDDAAKRRMLDEIIARCTEANRRLDAEAEGFDRLRALEQNAPQALSTPRRSCGTSPAAPTPRRPRSPRSARGTQPPRSSPSRATSSRPGTGWCSPRPSSARPARPSRRARAARPRCICGPPRAPSTRRARSWTPSADWPRSSRRRRASCPAR